MMRSKQSGLSVPREMAVDSLWQKAFSAALTASGQRRPTAFGRHASAKTVLTLASSF
jgi:hypothetical protein